MTPITNPYPLFSDTLSRLIDGARIYIGQPDQDPELYPKDVFWDAAMTIPAMQPLRTVAGYVVNNGTPAQPFVDGAYSIRVRQANGAVVYSQPRVLDNLSSFIATLSNPDGAEQIGFGTRSVDSKLRETVSVTDTRFAGGAKGDGVTDDTAAFNAAIATGKCVTVPKTDAGYIVNGITVVSNMEIVGEKSGECLGPELIVAVNGGCVFLQSASTDIAVHLVFRNLTMRAAIGTTGATGFRSADKSKYTAYATFENIETHRNLVWGYDLLPIYTDWINCRDGYLPGIGGFTMTHGFIRAEAATYGQTNATNTNNVIRAKVFGCYNVDASIQIAFGDTWLLEDCRFENMYVPAVKALSVIGLYISRPRSEGFHTTEWCTLREMPGSGVGTIAHIDGTLNAIDQPGFFYANTDALSRVGFQRGSFSIVGSGQKLVSNPLALLYNRDHPTISGVGAAGLMTGMGHDRRVSGQSLFNGAATNSNMALTSLNAGGTAATQGFASGNVAVPVGSDWVTIFTPASSVAMVAVGGIQTSGGGDGIGTQHAWPVLSTVGSAALFGTPINPTGVAAEFRKADGALQMRCTTGSATVMASALVS